MDSPLSATMSGKRNAESRSSGSATQTTPLVCRIMKAIASAEAISAAMIKSPSFSRFSSSTTIAMGPLAIALTAASTLFNAIWPPHLEFEPLRSSRAGAVSLRARIATAPAPSAQSGMVIACSMPTCLAR